MKFACTYSICSGVRGTSRAYTRRYIENTAVGGTWDSEESWLFGADCHHENVSGTAGDNNSSTAAVCLVPAYHRYTKNRNHRRRVRCGLPCCVPVFVFPEASRTYEVFLVFLVRKCENIIRIRAHKHLIDYYLLVPGTRYVAKKATFHSASAVCAPCLQSCPIPYGPRPQHRLGRPCIIALECFARVSLITSEQSEVFRVQASQLNTRTRKRTQRRFRASAWGNAICQG